MTTTSAALERRNLGLLVAVQSLGGATPPIIISLGGLVGQMLSSTPSAATCRSACTSWAWPCPRCPRPG